MTFRPGRATHAAPQVELVCILSDRRNLERVQDIDLFGLPNDYYQTLVSRIREVDPNEAQALARKYIPARDVAIIVVGDADQIRPQLEPLGPMAGPNRTRDGQCGICVGGSGGGWSTRSANRASERQRPRMIRRAGHAR